MKRIESNRQYVRGPSLWNHLIGSSHTAFDSFVLDVQNSFPYSIKNGSYPRSRPLDRKLDFSARNLQCEGHLPESRFDRKTRRVLRNKCWSFQLVNGWDVTRARQAKRWSMERALRNIDRSFACLNALEVNTFLLFFLFFLQKMYSQFRIVQHLNCNNLCYMLLIQTK